MNKKREQEYMTEAIAIYICTIAKKDNLFIADVNTDFLQKAFEFTNYEMEKAQRRAQNLIREFL